MNLRFIERDGKMILQQSPHPTTTKWEDVPTVHQQKIDLLVEELANGFRHYADTEKYKNYEWALAKYAVEFFKKKMPKERIQRDGWATFAYYNQALRDVHQALFCNKCKE